MMDDPTGNNESSVNTQAGQTGEANTQSQSGAFESAPSGDRNPTEAELIARQGAIGETRRDGPPLPDEPEEATASSERRVGFESAPQNDPPTEVAE